MTRQNRKTLSAERIALLLFLVAAGALMGWLLGVFLVFRNPLFEGAGRLFLLVWATLMIVGGSIGAFAAAKFSNARD